MSEGRSGMSLDEFSQLDPDEVAATCGGTTPADDGPNPGVAGEQEAIVADEEHLADPADDAADEAAAAPAPRRIQLRASHLTARLMEADPSLDEASALELLQEILNEDLEEGEERQAIHNGNQFVPNTLASAVDRFIGEQPEPDDADGAGSLPFDQDSPSASAPDGAPVDTGETPPAPEPEAASAAPTPPVDGERQLDSYREALRPLLEASVAARQSGTRDEADAAVWALALAVYEQGYALYQALNQSPEEAEKRLFQLPREEGQDVPVSPTRDEIAANPDLRELVWYYRIAVRSTLRVFEGKETIQENLEDFTWPSETHYRRQQSSSSRRHPRSAKRTAVPGLPPRPASEEPASSTTDDTAASEPETGVANSGVPKELEGPPTQPVPVVRTSEGRRTVSSSDAPEPERHVVRGGGRAAMRPSPKAPAAGRQSSDPVEESDAQQPQADGPADSADRDASRGKRKSDESILANLPEEVVVAMMQRVAEDDDPVEHWAYRTPQEQREEADRRLLLEYGQHSAA